jgi:hypothetical protein
MAVVLLGCLITFSPIRFMDFNPVQNAIGNLGDLYQITALNNTNGIYALEIDNNAPDDFKEVVYHKVRQAVYLIQRNNIIDKIQGMKSRLRVLHNNNH